LNAAEILRSLHDEGVQLWCEGDRLRYRAPKGRLGPELMRLLAEQKAEILRLLEIPPARAPAGNACWAPRQVATKHYPLSFAQERMWFLHQLNPDSCALNVAMGFELHGPLDVKALEKSLNDLVLRHEVFRTTYTTVEGAAVQTIAPADVANHSVLRIVDLDDTPGSGRVALDMLVREEARRPFDLTQLPVLRAWLGRMADDRHTLLLTTHHAVVDGWSAGIVVRELSSLYRAHATGHACDLAPPADRYRDYAAWQRDRLKDSLADDLFAYWKRQLDQVAPLDIPKDRPAPSSPSDRGGTFRFRLSASLSARLKALARSEHVTLYTLLLAAFQVLLSRYSRQDDIVVGTAVSDRCRPETQSIVGCFSNALAIRTVLAGDWSFRQLLANVRETTVAAFEHQDMPFELLVERLQPDRPLSRSPIFQVAFLLHQQTDHLELAGVSVRPIPIDLAAARYDILLEIEDGREELSGSFEYSADLFEERTIRRMAGHLETLLASVVDSPAEVLDKLPLLSPLERRRLLTEWSGADAEFPHQCGIHRLVEAQVQRTPDHPAVIFADRSLTYHALNAQANRVARHLRQLGIGPGVITAICADRSPLMIVGVLAILKAGGAYLPLDAGHPAERLEFMLEDSQAAVLVTQRHLRDSLPWQGSRLFVLDEPFGATEPAEAENLTDGPAAEDPAYVIYTSGSTGRPKGVLVAHRGLCNLAVWQGHAFGISGADRVLQFSPLTFDASVSEIFTTLCSGAALCMGSPEELLPGPNLVRFLESHRIAVATIPPSLLRMLPDAELPQLKTLVSAGEACSSDLIRRWSPGRHFINAYGPTEATVCATLGLCNHEGQARDIGRPLPNVRVYILNEKLQPAPIGVPGELCVGGVGVAKGYLNRAELTAERFVRNPFSNTVDDRLYRTGDIARWLEDGRLEYLGRSDAQVKIRGCRIELAEIESVLREQGEVAQAAVTIETDERGEKSLVAYLASGASPGRGDLELWPSTAEFFVYDDLLYHAMTHDELRNESYRRALTTRARDKVVLDIGTGPEALLARLALESGARKVYAVELLQSTFELAREAVERRGLADRIEVIHGEIRSVELPEKAEVCVSEIVGPIGGVEGAALLINEARRLLVDHAVLIPSQSRTAIAGLSLPDAFMADPVFTDLTAHYVRTIFAQVGYPFDLRLCLKHLASEHVVSTSGAFEELDFQSAVPLESSHDIELRITRDCRLDGFVVWLRLETMPGEVIDILQHEHCWLPVFLPVFDPGVMVSVSDIIRAKVTRSLCPNGINPDYRISGSIARSHNDEILFDYTSHHDRKLFRQSRFYERLFAGGEPRVAPRSKPTPSVRQVREALRKRLPDYMVPASFVVMDRLPLLSSGKLDRGALPRPVREQRNSRAPRTADEEMLCGIFAEILSVERVGIDDSFFELGGHSLLAMQLASRVRDSLGTGLTVRTIFEKPTVSELAAQLRGARGRQHPLVAAERPRTLPLSYAQERFWFLDRLGSDANYKITEAIRLRGVLNVALLEQAISVLAQRHEALRTRFAEVEGEPVQIIEPVAQVRLEIHDLEDHPASDSQEPINSALQILAREPFNLNRAPLMRIGLLRLGSGDHVLYWIWHHIIADGWSIDVFKRELSETYTALSQQRPTKLPELPFQYADYAIWQRNYLQGEQLERLLTYWRKQLADSVALELPLDRPRRELQTHTGATESIVFPHEFKKKLSILSREANATAFISLLAAVKVLLFRYTGQEDVSVGIPIANRGHAEFEHILGCLLNTLVLRTRVESKLIFRDFLSRVRETALEAYAHQELPFEKLLEELQPERTLNRTPLFQVVVNYASFGSDVLRLPELSLTNLGPFDIEARFDLSFYFSDFSEGLRLDLVYNRDLFAPDSIRRMLERFNTLLQSILLTPGEQVGALSILAPDDRKSRSFADNIVQPENSYLPFAETETEQAIAQRFARQVQRHPTQTAVKTLKHEWTYEELDRRADALARELLRVGSGTGARAALLLQPDAPMVAAVIACVKAGWTYIPLAPSQPAARIARILADAEAGVIVTDSANRLLANAVAAAGMQVIDIEASPHILGPERPTVEVSPDASAYLLYTSGSTGEPKGVVQSHRNVLHHIRNYTNALHITSEDRVLLLASYTFDAAVMDIFGALLNGATLLPFDLRTEGFASLASRISSERVTIYHSTPTLFRHFLRAVPDHTAFSGVRLVVLGGEPVSAQDCRLFKERFSRACILVNGFGQSEYSFSLQYLANAETLADSVPIGYPLDETEVLLLDTEGHSGQVFGEITIRSPHLAQGYWQRPELSAGVFARDPNKGNISVYRTGDLGRLRSDGAIDFVGRKDFQVKIRGHRVEPGEVEAMLCRHSEVEAAVVVARPSAEDEVELVAYIVSANDHRVSDDQLRTFLARNLPDYMLPSAIVVLEAMPLTLSGKINRQALPVPGRTRQAVQHVAPRTPFETALAGIWSELLRADGISVHDDFFEVGGHSLVAMRLVSMIRCKFDVEIPLRSIFERRTIEQLALYIAELQAEATAPEELEKLLSELESTP
jgi:amino acid adenylation domain-containing protein